MAVDSLTVLAEKLVPGFTYDGSDMSSKLQDAVDRAEVEGCRVGLRAGSIGLKSPVYFEGLQLQGAGWERTEFKQLNGTDPVWNGKGVLTHRSFMSNYTGNSHPFHLSHFSIMGNGARYGNGIAGCEAISTLDHIESRGFAGTDDPNGHDIYYAVGARTRNAVAMSARFLRLGSSNTKLYVPKNSAQVTDFQIDRVVFLEGGGKSPNDIDLYSAGGASIRHVKANGGSQGSCIRIRGFLELTISDIHIDGFAMSGTGYAIQIDQARAPGGCAIGPGCIQFRTTGPNVGPLYVNPNFTPDDGHVCVFGLGVVQHDDKCGPVVLPPHAEVAASFGTYGPGVQKGAKKA